MAVGRIDIEYDVRIAANVLLYAIIVICMTGK